MTRPSDSSSDPGAPDWPLPPARTRWIERRDTSGHGVETPLAPVRALRTGQDTAGPAVAPIGASPDGPARTIEPAEAQEAWHEPAATLDLEPPDMDIVQLEDPAEPAPPAPWAPEPLMALLPDDRTEPAEAGPDELLLLEEESLETIELLDETPAPDLQPVQTPLSPWELAAGPDAPAGDMERAVRGQREWQDFGQAIMASLGITENASLETAMQAMAEHLDQAEGLDVPGVPPEIVNVADRIASFASRLRARGYGVIAEAQSEGDPLDAALGRMAAAFLAGDQP